MILWYVQFLKSKMINIELFSDGSRGEFYLNIASYVSCILRHFVLFCWLRNSPFSNKDRVIYISQSRMPNRQRRCINIVFIFASQWKARVICSVLILENYHWCVLPLVYDQIIESVIDYWNKNSNKLYSRCQSMIRNIYT
jgi:hypothetical protein